MLRIIELLRDDPDFPKARMLFMVTISGCAGGAILAAINVATEQISLHNPDPQHFFITLLLLALMVYPQHYSLAQITLSVEDVLLKLRLRVGNRLRQADLRFIEEIGGTTIYAALTKDTQIVSQSALSMTLLARSALVVLVSLIYLGWISLFSLAATLVFIGAYAFIHAQLIHPNLVRKFDSSLAGEQVFFGRLQALLGGFKEAKQNRRKNDNLFEQYGRSAADISTRKRGINAEITKSYTIGYSAFYLLLIVLVVVIPGMRSELTVHVFKITAIVIYIISELDPWLTWIPEITRANAAVEDLCHLEQILNESPHADPPRPPKPLTDFTAITLDGVEFRYPDRSGQKPFPVGPIDLTLAKGELLFIVGGNGSGKTTLLKLLAGLYYPRAGGIEVDGRPILAADYPSYRELFSAVFPDFYLFDRLHGTPDIEPARVEAWLKTMELTGKTRFAEGGFTQQNLSTGQRKRLAFIAAVLEDKPILIVDEFAADQDPAFRERFYREILPSLKNQGKTLVAVTHDDRYFDLADRVLTMADGHLR